MRRDAQREMLLWKKALRKFKEDVTVSRWPQRQGGSTPGYWFRKQWYILRSDAWRERWAKLPYN
jgi:hypothetical protein